MNRFYAFVAVLAAILLGLTPASAQETLLQKKASSLVVDAVALYEDQEVAKAAALLSTALDLDPSNDAASYYLGLCRMRKGEYKEAQNLFASAVAADSTNYWYLDAYASSCVYLNQKGPAVESYSKLIKLFPQKPDAYYTLGEIYRRTGEYDKMYESFETLSVRFGATADVLCMMAEYNLRQDRDSVALQMYAEALEMDPEYLGAYYGRSEVYRLNGNYPAYFSDITKVIASPAVEPSLKVGTIRDIFQTRDVNLVRFNRVQIDALVDTMSVVHPADTLVTPFVISYYYSMGDYKKMSSHAGRYAKARPEDSEAQVMYIQTLSTLGQADAALSYTEECISRFPKEDVFLEYAADMLYDRGQASKAYKYYDKALKINPDNYGVLNNYAYYLSISGGNLRKAYKMSSKTVKAEPDNATFLDTFGWILHLMGKDIEAKPVFKHAMLYGGKESAVMLAHYSLVLEALGEKEMATVYRNLAEKKKEEKKDE